MPIVLWHLLSTEEEFIAGADKRERFIRKVDEESAYRRGGCHKELSE